MKLKFQTVDACQGRVSHVKNEMRVAQEEIFGPMVCVVPFDTKEVAASLVNGTKFGLAGAIWTTNVRLEDCSVALSCFEITQAITVYSSCADTDPARFSAWSS